MMCDMSPRMKEIRRKTLLDIAKRQATLRHLFLIVSLKEEPDRRFYRTIALGLLKAQ